MMSEALSELAEASVEYEQLKEEQSQHEQHSATIKFYLSLQTCNGEDGDPSGHDMRLRLSAELTETQRKIANAQAGSQAAHSRCCALTEDLAALQTTCIQLLKTQNELDSLKRVVRAMEAHLEEPVACSSKLSSDSRTRGWGPEKVNCSAALVSGIHFTI
jgi:hypothetical protein